MKVHVVADADGNVVGTMVVEPAHAGRAQHSHLFPLRKAHKLHRVEVPDEYGSLQADELHQRLKEHLGGSTSS